MSIVNRVFDATLRPYLPPQLVTHGGVECYFGSILDRTLEDDPDYEVAVRAAQDELVREGDHVRIVGGGCGVTAVTAARHGAERVDVAEAASAPVDRCRRTIGHHGLRSRVSVVHARVGPADEAYDGALADRTLPVEWARKCDVLELDCEGAEIDILSALDPGDGLPHCMIVETHGCFGSPTDEVRDQVERLGYRVESEEPEVPERDVMVLAAVRELDVDRDETHLVGSREGSA